MRVADGTFFTVLGILDAGSRRVLRLKQLSSKCTLALLGHVLLACSEYGLPEAIRSDNEAMFTSRLWLATLQALGIHARRGPPAQPWRNGRIERWWATLEQGLRDASLRSAEEMQEALDAFAGFYNQVRPHQALGGLTPQEAWQGMSMAEVQHAHAQGRYRRRFRALLDGFRIGEEEG